MRKLTAALITLLAMSCGGGANDLGDSQDGLDSVGSIVGESSWGAATHCEALPAGVPQLESPAVVISLDGLTLHLWHRQGTFDKVYPIGPGAIENGVSLTPVGHFTTGPADKADHPRHGGLPLIHAFCTVKCAGACADRPGEIGTACIPAGQGAGICVRQGSALNNDCRYSQNFRFAPRKGSASQPKWTRATVHAKVRRLSQRARP